MRPNSSQEVTNVDVSDEYDSPPNMDSVRCRLSVNHPEDGTMRVFLNGGKKNEENNTQILLGSDNEDELTSSGVSEEEEEDDDDDEEEEEEDISIGTNFEEGNTILQPCNSRKNLPDLLATTPKDNNVSFIPTINQEIVPTNSDQMIAQTMAALADKYRHTTPRNSTSVENEILAFVGPCPLYSLPSSFGLDMHHGLTHFPCRDMLAGGEGHTSAAPLWQHLTSIHNLNMSTASCIISHLLIHGYSSPSPILFHSNDINTLLRTTPRYSLVKRCPLNVFGFYGIRREHGTRICSGFTLNSNLYCHLRSFHKMTHEAAERLARAIAFHDEEFKFEPDEIIVNERINCPILKWCQMTKNNINEHFKYEHRLANKQRRLLRKYINQQEANPMIEPVNQC